ncbi:hypothetical protein F4778DRAFT_797127 [Xylariomycetidae sp. FL2044]|nr:hypothetical protein F4778DRAFT_797127 [Xylariomycetidae sp. FL2044]
MAARKLSALSWISTLVLSLLSLLFILLVLFSGVGGHVIAEYLKIDTSSLSIPAKLSGSVFLQDLSKVAGNDFVGRESNAATLGLAATYSLTLLTACAHDDTSTTCGTPRIGFHFNPGADLRLESTSITGSFSSAYSDQLQTYSTVSTFLGAAYVIAILLIALSCVGLIVSRCAPRAIIASQIASAIASALLLAAAIASVVTFTKLRDTFNSTLGPAGIKTSLGASIFGLSFAAFAFALFAFIAMLVLNRGSRSQSGSRRRAMGTRSFLTGEENDEAREPSGPGFLKKMSTWNRHEYTQVHKQGSRAVSRSSDREALIASDEYLADEQPHAVTTGPMYEKRSRSPSPSPAPAQRPPVGFSFQAETAYDPFSGSSR